MRRRVGLRAIRNLRIFKRVYEFLRHHKRIGGIILSRGNVQSAFNFGE